MSTTNELINLFKTTKEFIPINKTGETAPSSTNDYQKQIELLIITKTAREVHTFIPILTSRVFYTYERNLRKDLASAAIAASLKNKQTSKLTSEVNTLIEKENIVSTSLMNSIIMDKVTNEVAKAKNRITHLENRNRQAFKTLARKRALSFTSSPPTSDPNSTCKNPPSSTVPSNTYRPTSSTPSSNKLNNYKSNRLNNSPAPSFATFINSTSTVTSHATSSKPASLEKDPIESSNEDSFSMTYTYDKKRKATATMTKNFTASLKNEKEWPTQQRY